MKDMTELAYKQLLDKTYQGNVTLISRFSTLRATGVFRCSKCEKKFYNRVFYMVGSIEGFHHLCGERYASTNTNSRKDSGIKRHKKKRG